jgi:hypothetical protein
MATLAEMLRQGANRLINLPTEAQRFMYNPQAFTQMFGRNQLPNETGFAEGAMVGDRKYGSEKGFKQGEPLALPIAVASMGAPLAAPTARALAPKAASMAEDYLAKIGGIQYIAPQNKVLAEAIRNKPIGDFDPRFDPRVLEKQKIATTVPVVEQINKTEIPKVSLADFEGRPFITSMSDRTAAGGDLLGVNDVMFKRPVHLYGGQDYMFNAPNQVWASAQQAVSPITKNAEMLKEVTGQNPLYIPWRMAPTSGDFAHMTGESMLGYAEAAMSRGDKKQLNTAIKDLIPNWKGVDNAESIAQYRAAPKVVRDSIMQIMDRDFRDLGSLNIGQARLSVTDPRQINAVEGGIQNVGEIFAGQPMIMKSGHPSYPRGVAGQGLGTLEREHNIFELLPNVIKERGIANPTAPAQTDLRALQMKPYAGILTANLLRQLGY